MKKIGIKKAANLVSLGKAEFTTIHGVNGSELFVHVFGQGQFWLKSYKTTNGADRAKERLS
ncbi:MAG: hypothetical protein NC548_38145 [Lachnospiraceae bacterium]|nr:hypothetical protein [Lachnospiraceae bacterium]